ncbi:MAG: DegV family protein [Anaerolineae bacterium]|nr:DegV family protein [Anaerolineae bacterium]
MVNIQIVTDSTAHFTNPQLVQQYGITVVPNTIRIAGKTYKEGVDLSAEDAMRLSAHEQAVPAVISPSEAEFGVVYRQLAEVCDAIISIHPSRKIFPSWDQARAAAIQIAGQCEVVVIDSQTLSAGQAMLVRVAARAVESETNLEDVVRKVRGAVDRVYSVFYVDVINSLLQHEVMSRSHVILGAMLGMKPFLTIEDGELRPIEKVRTRSQALERLVEFVTEFTDIEDVVILQNKAYAGDQTRMLQDRLAIEFPERHFPYALYGPSLAALIGIEAMGIVLLESEMEFLDDDF